MRSPLMVTCTKCYSTGDAKQAPGGSSWITLALLAVSVGAAALFWTENADRKSASEIEKVAELTEQISPEAAAALRRSEEHANALDEKAGPTLGVGELVVALGFICAPALSYQLWRRKRRRSYCASCGSTEVVPHDSPRGRQIQASTSSSQA